MDSFSHSRTCAHDVNVNTASIITTHENTTTDENRGGGGFSKEDHKDADEDIS